MKLGIFRGILIVIENKGKGEGHTKEKGLEVVAGEGEHTRPVFGAEKRQGFVPPFAESPAGFRHVVEEARCVAISLIDPVPEGGNTPGLKITCKKCSLPRTRYGGNPGDGEDLHLVQKREETVPRDYIAESRSRYFCQAHTDP